MAQFKFDGEGDVLAFFDRIAEIPNDVIEEMLDVQAQILVAEQKRTAEQMLQGNYYQGGIVRGVKASEPIVTYYGGRQEVRFEGTQHGNRLAEIAYVNEYGARGNPGRPFIATANARAEPQALKAAEQVYQDWLDSKE